MDDTSPAFGPVRRRALKAALTVIYGLCLTLLPFALIGLWNRVFGTWRSVFFCYAGSRNYVATYAPAPFVAMVRWMPSPIGVLRQGGAWGLVLAAPVTEAEFLDPANAAAFGRLLARIGRIARLMGVAEVNLAGILPGVSQAQAALPLRDGRGIVVQAVLAAIDRIVADRFAGRWPPVIVLGGAGRIGTELTLALRRAGRDLHVVDPAGGAAALPAPLRGRPALLVDVARKGVLARYVPQMWPGMVVLNETFPRPSRTDLALLRAQGVEVWHLSGLAGRVIPPLPFGYENAVPCCAAHAVGTPPQVRLVRLVPPGAGMPECLQDNGGNQAGDHAALIP